MRFLKILKLLNLIYALKPETDNLETIVLNIWPINFIK